MSGTLTFGTDNIILNGGGGDVTVGPDISMSDNGFIVAKDALYLGFDGNNDNAGLFAICKSSEALDGSHVNLFTIPQNGVLRTWTADYETLVTHDDHIPNKRYVDDTSASSVPIGTVIMFAGYAAVPSGYAFCQGQSVSTSGVYADLFAIIGHTFGGSGGSFNIPDFRGRLPGGVGVTNPVPAYGGGSLSLAQKLGQWYSRLTSSNQLPWHNHGGGNHHHTSVEPINTVAREQGPDPILHQSGTRNTSDSGNIITGQGLSSNISTYPPILGINFIIKY